MSTFVTRTSILGLK